MSLIAYDGQIELDEDDWQDADESRVSDDDDDEWACEFGERCLMPGYFHRRDECHTVEMAEQWADEMAKEES